jgi:DNA-binding winged helix-turn-helix (wHTH) protein
MDAHQETSFILGEINVSPSHNTLQARGATLKMQPKAMAVLYYLAANQSRVISNEELIERLWEGRVVTHGSVQKSINTLRSAFSELIGDQELIAHYSKRGYQLKLAPQFQAAPLIDVLPEITTPEAPSKHANKNPRLVGVFWALGLLLAIVVAYTIAVYKGINWNLMVPPKHHKTAFHSTLGYTNETGHERSATPHPDNLHVAYIREKFNTNYLGETDSDIIIRNSTGKDWRIANSQGSWFKLAWSPAGENLVAVEVKRRDGLPLGTSFYEKPNYLYSFHIFTLDLEHERLLEKQQLSQWQGRIFSVTWWDENTLEIVAKQGPNSGNGRYRYSILDQQLKLLDEVEGANNPIASTVLKQTTALASLHKIKFKLIS